MTTPPDDAEDTTAQLWSHGGEIAGWRKTNSAVGIAPRNMTLLDLLIIVCGVLVLLLSFFSYYTHTLSRSFGTTSRVSNAWDEVGADVWGSVAAVAAAVGALSLLLAILLFNAGARSWLRLAVTGLYLGAATMLGVAYFAVPHYSFAEFDGYFADSTDGHGYAYWASVLLVVVATALCAKRLREVAADAGQAGGSAVDAPQEQVVPQSGPIAADVESRPTRAQRRAAESRRGRHSG